MTTTAVSRLPDDFFNLDIHARALARTGEAEEALIAQERDELDAAMESLDLAMKWSVSETEPRPIPLLDGLLHEIRRRGSTDDSAVAAAIHAVFSSSNDLADGRRELLEQRLTRLPDRSFNFSTLSTTFKPLHGVEFDLRGRIHLDGKIRSAEQQLSEREGANFAGRNIPLQVDGIDVGQTTRAIHFLMSLSYGRETSEPVEVASFVIHYDDGDSEVFSVTSPDLVNDTWSTPTDERNLGWTGRHPGSELSVSELIWKNPHPDKLINHIDFESANRYAAPFLVAITLE